jgi:hypothetical protein
MIRLRLSRRYSSASSGSKKKASSVSEGRSDHPQGEPAPFSCLSAMVDGRESSKSRASYLQDELSEKGRKSRKSEHRRMALSVIKL